MTVTAAEMPCESGKTKALLAEHAVGSRGGKVMALESQSSQSLTSRSRQQSSCGFLHETLQPLNPYVLVPPALVPQHPDNCKEEYAHIAGNQLSCVWKVVGKIGCYSTLATSILSGQLCKGSSNISSSSSFLTHGTGTRVFHAAYSHHTGHCHACNTVQHFPVAWPHCSLVATVDEQVTTAQVCKINL